jgi:hypothetical protein
MSWGYASYGRAYGYAPGVAAGGGPAPDPVFSVLDGAAAPHSVPLTVLVGDGSSHTAAATVLDGAGASHVPA